MGYAVASICSWLSTMKRGPKSAEEVMAQLRSDPEWVRQSSGRERIRKAALEELSKAQEPLLVALASAGLPLTSVYDLVNTKSKYDAAIPILLRHLSKPYPNKIREGIARSLGRRWARNLAWDQVLRAYRNEANKARSASPGEIGAPSGPKDGLAVALSCMAEPDDLAQLIELITDPRNGPSRIFFVTNLSRSRRSVARNALLNLRGDPDLRVAVNHCLRGKMKRQAKSAQAGRAIRH